MTPARRAHPNVDPVLLDGANDARLRRRGEPARGAAARAPPHCRHRRPGEQKLDELTLLSKLRNSPEGFPRHWPPRLCRAGMGDPRGAADAAASRAESGFTASSRAEVERARRDPPLGDDTAPLVGRKRPSRQAARPRDVHVPASAHRRASRRRQADHARGGPRRSESRKTATRASSTTTCGSSTRRGRRCVEHPSRVRTPPDRRR